MSTKRSRTILRKHSGLIFLLCVTACEAVPSPIPSAAATQPGHKSYYDCVDREAKAVVASKIKKDGEDYLYGYHATMDAEVSSICKQHAMDGVAPIDDLAYVNAAVEGQVKASLDNKIKRELEDERKKAALDEPRRIAQETQEHAVTGVYYQCLTRHARVMALNSIEPAETIAEASFPSCAKERQATVDVFQKLPGVTGTEVVDVIDTRFLRRLLLEVIKTRAEPPPPPPEPPPAKHETRL